MRLTYEDLRDYCVLLTNKLKSSVKKVESCDNKGFIEFEDGSRYAIKSYWGGKVTDLGMLKQECKYFIDRIIKQLDPDLILYLDTDLHIQYVHPTHLDTSTGDFIEKPSEGYWMPYIRLRQPGHEIKKFDL